MNLGDITLRIESTVKVVSILVVILPVGKDIFNRSHRARSAFSDLRR